MPAIAIGLILLLLLSGCGSGDGQKLIPVSGKVTVAGTPLHRGNVSFRADTAAGEKTAAEPYGEISADGTSTLFTSKKKGAPLGKYIVLVEASEEIDPKNASATPKSLINRKYADPSKPLLRIEVVESPKPDHFDIRLEK